MRISGRDVLQGLGGPAVGASPQSPSVSVFPTLSSGLALSSSRKTVHVVANVAVLVARVNSGALQESSQRSLECKGIQKPCDRQHSHLTRGEGARAFPFPVNQSQCHFHWQSHHRCHTWSSGLLSPGGCWAP